MLFKTRSAYFVDLIFKKKLAKVLAFTKAEEAIHMVVENVTLVEQ